MVGLPLQEEMMTYHLKDRVTAHEGQVFDDRITVVFAAFVNMESSGEAC